MRRIWGVLIALSAACAGGGESKKTNVVVPTTAGDRARLPVKRASEVESGTPASPPLALELGRPERGAPHRLAKELGAGRTWLQLSRPVRFSFVGRDLMAGNEVFRPAKSSVTFAQAVRANEKRKEPALLRLEGNTPASEVDALLEVVENPKITPRGFQGIERQDIRINVGRGIDTLMSLAGPDKGGFNDFDTRAPVAVFDENGPVDNARDLFVEAYAQGSVKPLRPYHLVIRRYRAHATPKETFFKLPLVHVCIAAQMSMRRAGGSVVWTWEGLWRGEMQEAPSAVRAPEGWKTPPDVVVLYKEYVPQKERGDSGIVRTLMTPLTLGADFGRAFFEEEDSSIIDRVRDKQRARK